MLEILYTQCRSITASAAALSSSKDDFASRGKHAFFGPHKTETPSPINMKLCITDYVTEMVKRTKNGWNRITAGVSPYT